MKQYSAFLLVAAMAACGGAKGASVPPIPDNAKFDDLTHQQQEVFMKERVMPVMSKLFQEHNPEEFKEFTCKTCHGQDAKERHFEMPNPGLDKLNFDDMSKWKKEDLDFMQQKVKPEMARLLGQPEYTPENPTGFGCLGCHMKAE